MLRISEYVRRALKDEVCKPFDGTILIWNITNRCNLYCKHCYSSANQETEGDLTLEEIKRISESLRKNGIKFVILSGGEPLLREDVYEIANILRSRGMRTYLSTNGLLINKENVRKIAKSFDYVGISIDGTPEVHDSFRGRKHAFEESLNALILCMKNRIKVGLRFTLSEKTSESLPFIFELVEEVGIPKVYISHLVYSGRGRKLSGVERERYKGYVEYIIGKAFEYVEKGKEIDIVTGNNEADAIVLYQMFKERYPEKARALWETLKRWGGNQAGVRLVNIDFRGNVKPDPFFSLSLGNLRERSFTEIWNSNGILNRLRERPRRIQGRCSECPYLEICNGNSRARAFFATGDYFKEDPACYL